MIRTLAIIAVAGFLVSVVTLSAAVGITGPEAIANGAWSWGPFGWTDDHDGRHHENRFEITTSHASDNDGPRTSRDISWAGGGALDVDLPAEVQYTQAAGPPKVTVSGPQGLVNDVEIENGHIQYKNDHDDDVRLTIVITASSVTRFVMEGSGKLSIANYRQDKLDLDLQGDADVAAAGEAKAIQLAISGSADANLGGVRAQSAKVEIEGSGDATLAPTDAADITISGSGDVTLLTHPAKLRSEVSGSGKVRHEDRAATSGAAR